MPAARETVLLITRPAAAGRRLAEAFADRPNLRIIVSPLLEIVWLHPTEPLPPAATVILSSAHAVPALARLECPPRAVKTVGAQTAEAVRAAGFAASVAGETADELVAALIADPPDGPVLHLRGVHARGDVAARLTAAGIATCEAIVYDQVARPLSDAAKAALAGDVPVVVPLFSPRSARLLSEAAADAAAPVLPVAMSDAVAEAAGPRFAAEMTIAATPTRAAMTRAIAARIEAASRVEAGPGAS